MAVAKLRSVVESADAADGDVAPDVQPLLEDVSHLRKSGRERERSGHLCGKRRTMHAVQIQIQSHWIDLHVLVAVIVPTFPFRVEPPFINSSFLTHRDKTSI